jgi:hypothetical protein
VILTARKTKTTQNMKVRTASGILRAYLLLPAIEAAFAIALVFATPSEGGRALALGLSPSRWVLVLGLLALGALSAILFWLQRKKHKSWPPIERSVLSAIRHPVFYPFLIALSLVVAVGAFYLLLLTFKFTDDYVRSLLLRAFPLVLWLFLLSVQTIILAPRLRFGGRPSQAHAWRAGLIAFGVIGLMALFVSMTGLGLQPDGTGWENPGTPLLATQILIAWLGALLLYGLIRLLEKRFGWRLSRLDLAAALIIWLLAIWLWQAEPLTPTFFSPTPRPPNAQFYPYSDAATHDLAAQRFLVGEGFTEVVEKPLYSFFLVMLHTLVGQDYANLVAAQIVVLAFFPAVLYFLGGQMHHRFSGAILALAIILRETNSIALSGEINISHSKLLMTDLPAALGMALFTLLLLRWLQADHRKLRWPLWVGAALGALLLLRSQIIILIPILLVVAWWHGGKTLRTRSAYAGLLLLGFALTAVPWMWRNYQHTGQFGYSQPLQALYLAKQYSLTPEEADPGFPEGTQVSEYVSLGFAKVVQFSLSYPSEVAGFITAHFLHNEVSSLLALPMRFDLADKMVTFYNLRPFWIDAEDRLWSECCSLESYINDTPYWQEWDGALPADAWLPLLANMVILSIGVAAVWRKVSWLVLVPIGIHIFYNLSTSIARVSGWRLILPVDWVLLLFYCVGLGHLTAWAWRFLMGADLTVVARPPARGSQVENWRGQGLLVLAGGLLLAGALLPLAEGIIPARYAKLNSDAAAAAWQASPLSELTELDVEIFLRQTGAHLFWGRGLYPRYYAAGTGEPGGNGSAFNIQPFTRLAFWVVGPEYNQVALPLQESPSFPNGVDVIVLGCAEDTYFRASAVLFPGGEAPDVIADDPNLFVCSPTAEP